jgi:anion-transporting  ArsA/GET3 family ATPase
MAAEKVHQLVSDSRFDVIVVDTPPASNALDFVTAPRRLVRFLDHTLFRLVIAPGKGALRLVSGAAQTLLKPLTQVIGGAAVADAIEFFRLFDGLEEGFRERAKSALEILTDQRTAWVLIATSEPEPLSAALEFSKHIHQTGISVTGVVLNRTEPLYEGLPARAPGRGEAGRSLGRILDDHRAQARHDQAAVAELTRTFDRAIVAMVSRFSPSLDPGQALDKLSQVWSSQPSPGSH